MDFTHFDEKGRALMVAVTEKNETERCAVAKGRILVSRRVYEAIEEMCIRDRTEGDTGEDGQRRDGTVYGREEYTGSGRYEGV